MLSALRVQWALLLALAGAWPGAGFLECPAGLKPHRSPVSLVQAPTHAHTVPCPSPSSAPAWSGARCHLQDAQGSPPAGFLLIATLSGSGSPPLYGGGNGGSGTKAHPGSPCVRDKPEFPLNQHRSLGRGLGWERGCGACNPLQTLPGPGVSHTRGTTASPARLTPASGDLGSPGLIRCSLVQRSQLLWHR